MMIRVCLAGATGWEGQPLAAAIQAAADLDLVAAVAHRGRGSGSASSRSWAPSTKR
jgi:4-hydroxy-tetrahydrodipicolinate reductase